jgi:hypothetical protein
MFTPRLVMSIGYCEQKTTYFNRISEVKFSCPTNTN